LKVARRARRYFKLNFDPTSDLKSNHSFFQRFYSTENQAQPRVQRIKAANEILDEGPRPVRKRQDYRL
jgi:hypothetical protein